MCIDIHIHTKRCHHAEGDLEDYIKEAIKKKIKVIGFSEHAPLPFNLDKRLSLEEAKKYVEDVERLKTKYQNQIKILCGFEIDYVEQYEEQIRNFIKDIKADYFLGSIHFIKVGDKTYHVWNYNDIFNNEKLQEEYFRLMIKAIKTRLFHSISHPDLILRSGINTNKLKDKFEEIFMVLAENDVGYEINCSGIFKTRYSNNDKMMVSGGFLNKEYLITASKLGVWFTIGSDAHKIENLGQGINEMLDYSDKNNLKIYYYDKCKRIEFKR